jgi:hypothetical protein
MACLKSSCLSQWMSRRRPEGGLLPQAQKAPSSSSPNTLSSYYGRWAFKRNTSSPGLCKQCRKLNFTKILKIKKRPYVGRPPPTSPCGERSVSWTGFVLIRVVCCATSLAKRYLIFLEYQLLMMSLYCSLAKLRRYFLLVEKSNPHSRRIS